MCSLIEAKAEYLRRVNAVDSQLQKEKDKRQADLNKRIKANTSMVSLTVQAKNDIIADEYARVCKHSMVFDPNLIRSLSTLHHREECIRWVRYVNMHCIQVLKALKAGDIR